MTIFGISAAKIWLGIGQTIYMVGLSLIFGLIIAFPLAILLFVTRGGGINENLVINKIVGTIINIIRSVPFIILIVYIMPLTKVIVGTRVGSTAALVPLTAYIAPYLARLIEGGADVQMIGKTDRNCSSGSGRWNNRSGSGNGCKHFSDNF